MNWKPQRLPWKVTEPQIDPRRGDALEYRPVLDASLALPESDLNKIPDRLPRQEATFGVSDGFCPECGGFMRSEEHGDTVCVACGLVEAGSPVFDRKEIADRARDAACEVTTHTHEPSLKQKLNSATIDRRVENIVFSLDNQDQITEIFGGKYFIKMSSILALYNEDPINYTPITRFQLRDSFEKRILSRREAKIDRLIEKMLTKALRPIDDKIINAMCQHDPVVTEMFFPGLFLYEGTSRTKRHDHEEGDSKIWTKLREHRRAAQVRAALERPVIPVVIHRKYNVGNESKTITFTFMYNRIHMGGDEIDNRFENFFFSEAIKRGYPWKMHQCPGTKKICHWYVKEARDMFISSFRKLGGFVKDPFYDAAPYLTQNGTKGTV